MKFKCIRGVVTTSGPVAIGQVVELPAHEAKVLMAQGKFVPHDETEIRTASIQPYETQDIPRRRGRKPKGD